MKNMLFQVENTPTGYMVSCCREYERTWQRLRNFGDRQGDAKEFCMYDCPKLEESQIRLLIKNFNPRKKYERVSSRKFIVQ